MCKHTMKGRLAVKKGQTVSNIYRKKTDLFICLVASLMSHAHAPLYLITYRLHCLYCRTVSYNSQQNGLIRIPSMFISQMIIMSIYVYPDETLMKTETKTTTIS